MLNRTTYYFFIVIMSFYMIPVKMLGQGAIIDTAFYNSLPSQSTYGDGAKSEAEALKDIFKVDLKPFCPEVGFQGYTASTCTGWAVGYAAQSIQYAIEKNWEGETDKITNHAFSALFIYNQLKNKAVKSCGVGTSIGKALTLLETKGNVLSKAFDKENDCNKLPGEAELNFAKNYQIKNFITLFKAGEKPKVATHKMKLSLAQKKPVIIAMPITKKFQQLKKAFWTPLKNDQPAGHHALVIVGFDEDKEAFEVMNSWGKRWAIGGFCWIKYDDFTNVNIEAYQMDMFTTEQNADTIAFKTTHLTANFSFNSPVEYNEFTIFKNINLLYDEGKGMYEIEENLKVNDIAQFNLSSISARTYVYMFSYDANSGLNVHWPRDEKLDNKFNGLHESALVTVPEVKLILPEPETAFQFKTAGEEYLCFLLSKSPIEDFNSKLSLLAIENESCFIENINKIFTTQNEDTSGTIYQSGKVAEFSSYVNSAQVVPVIFKLNIIEN